MSAFVNPLLRPAIVKLADIRFTSYSKGPGKVSVEVVQIEQQGPLRRGEHPEVRQVSVPAELHGESGSRRILQVDRHDLGRTPIEGEGRDHHPSVADGDEIGFTRGVLGFEDRYRVRLARCRLPSRVIGECDVGAHPPAVAPPAPRRWGGLWWSRQSSHHSSSRSTFRLLTAIQEPWTFPIPPGHDGTCVNEVGLTA